VHVAAVWRLTLLSHGESGEAPLVEGDLIAVLPHREDIAAYTAGKRAFVVRALASAGIQPGRR
jgi:hypothetical protein